MENGPVESNGKSEKGPCGSNEKGNGPGGDMRGTVLKVTKREEWTNE